ncbi:MAG: flagellar protein FlgN [Gammaproteobacteria bacterium]|nr:flagellar protein FlgN [Gammaproteobacteria bacterium]
MDNINKGNRLNTLLQRHIQQVTALSTLLLQEYQALRAGHTDKIEQISLEKNRLLNELKNLEKEQQQFISSIFAEQEKPNVTMIIANMAPQYSETLTPLNEKLTQLAEQP